MRELAASLKPDHMIEFWAPGSEPICVSTAKSNGLCSPGAADSCDEIRKSLGSFKYLIIDTVFDGLHIMIIKSAANIKLKQYAIKKIGMPKFALRSYLRVA